MKKNLNILNIDGVDGIGKTTQINMLTMSLKNSGVPVLRVSVDDTVESALGCAGQMWNFLKLNPNGLVLSDGSIARMIVTDFLDGMLRTDIEEKYRSVIYEYEKLHHKYGITNILMVTSDIDYCHQRMLKRGRIIKKPEDGIKDFQREIEVVRAMRYFDSNAISKQLIFQAFEVDEDDSILEVQDSLWEYLEANFEIKKPSEEDSS